MKALEIGVTTLELDVVISADSRVVVSHDPFFSSKICSHPDGRPVIPAEEEDLRLFAMTYDQIRQFDCGMRGHPDFPNQVRTAARKPLLSDFISAIEARSGELERSPVRYNIETKSSVEGDGANHPGPEVFARLIAGVITRAGVAERTTVQSFDPRTLALLYDHSSGMKISLLIGLSTDQGLDSNLKGIGFLPDTYSPHYALVDSVLVRSVHEKGMAIIPWTVNDEADMVRLIEFGVDGLITDYPDRGLRVLRSR